MKADALSRHTIHITSNKKIFDPKYESFTSEIIKTAVEAGKLLYMANGIYVNNNVDRMLRRREYQERACELYDSLVYMIRIAHSLYSLRKRKYEYWVRMTVETRKLARAWRDSDAQRYGYLLSGIKAV